MFNLENTPGRTAVIDGKEHLFFTGYSYLGMNHVPGFIELVKEGIDKYGLLFPSSRISNTQLDLFSAFEAKLSEITGMEETVCFSSGFLAGRAITNNFIWAGSYFFSSPETHPAISVSRDVIVARNFNEWSGKVTKHINKLKTTSPIYIMGDSVNPLLSNINNYSFLEGIKHVIACTIDDSHGMGLLNDGQGILKSLPFKDNVNYTLVYSLSKAYNLVGGAVSCSKKIAKELRSSPDYTASTSIPPAFAFAFINGQHLYQQQREKLQKNILLFRSIMGNKLNSHPELPIFILPADTDEKKLEEAGFIISSFAYPDPAGEKIKRVVLNALHTEDDLYRLAEALK